MAEEEAAEESAVAGDEAVGELDQPDERPALGESDEARTPANLREDKEDGAAGFETAAVGGEDLDGALGAGVERRGHRRAGAGLVRLGPEPRRVVMPPDPGDGVPSEESVAVVDEPVGHGQSAVGGRQSAEETTVFGASVRHGPVW